VSVSALHGSAAAASGPATGESDGVHGDEPRAATPAARREPDDVARPGSERDEVDVSVLVPAKDEAENLPLFMEQARNAFAGSPLCYEVIVVDDGSDDDTWAVLQGLQQRYSFLRLARHRKRRGIADALRTGYLVSRGRVLVFYPADLQYKPEDIPRLVAPIIAGESDMVTGHKQGIYEKAFVSRIYNRLSRTLFDVPVRDLNSVKAYRREVMDVLPVRPDWHRYMIVVAAASGFSVSEIPVPLYARHAGRSKFGIGRIPVGVLDMLSVWFELHFGKKPLLLFGMLGFALLAAGALAFLVALIRLWVSGVGVRWVWMIIQTCLILGSIFFVGGLVGEMIAGQRSELRELRRRLAEHDASWSDREPG
jgi:glycosyltransferase involved in cell wall biosynthesis